MLESINIRPYLLQYGKEIESVSCGGESGPDARICDYGWVLNTHLQCVEYGVPFHFHQTGAKLRHHGKIYEIPRDQQHEQARKAGLDYGGGLEIPEYLQNCPVDGTSVRATTFEQQGWKGTLFLL